MKIPQVKEHELSNRYVWVCEYDKHSGIDRECCGARAKKPTTWRLAMLGAARHSRNPGKRWLGTHTPVHVFPLRKYQRWGK